MDARLLLFPCRARTLGAIGFFFQRTHRAHFFFHFFFPASIVRVTVEKKKIFFFSALSTSMNQRTGHRDVLTTAPTGVRNEARTLHPRAQQQGLGQVEQTNDHLNSTCSTRADCGPEVVIADDAMDYIDDAVALFSGWFETSDAKVCRVERAQPAIASSTRLNIRIVQRNHSCLSKRTVRVVLGNGRTSRLHAAVQCLYSFEKVDRRRICNM